MKNIKNCTCGEPLERCESCGELMCVVCDNARMDENGVWICEDCYQECIITLIKSDTVRAELIVRCPHPKTDDKDLFDVITTIALIAEKEAEERHAKALQELRDRAVEAFRQVCPLGHPSRAENVGLKSYAVCPNIQIIGFPCCNNVECPFISALTQKLTKK